MKLPNPKSRRHHRVAHRAAHQWEPCEVCGIVKVLRSEDVRHDKVVGKAGNGTLRVSIADIALPLARAGLRTECRVG